MAELQRVSNLIGGREAIGNYLQTKTVWIDTIGKTANPFVLR
jgi:aldehyde dehydrogenase (NAD+)